MPTPPGYADISVEITLTGMNRPAYVTFGVNPTATDPLAVANSVNLAVAGSPSFQGGLDSNASITKIRASVGTDGGEDLIGEVPGIGAGMLGVTSLPPNCALLVHKHTSRGGRRGRGRMFIPWMVGEPDVDEAGLIASSPLAQHQTRMTAFLGELADNDVPMVLLHGPGGTTPGAPDVVSSLRCDPLISTQRRRLGR